MLKNFGSFAIFTLKDTAKNFGNLEISQLLKFHFVFDEIALNTDYSDIFEAIMAEILLKFENFLPRFDFENLAKIEIKKALMKLAKSDRKTIGIAKILPRFKAQKITNELIQIGFLELEKSSEILRVKTHKNEKLPRILRRYKTSPKVRFRSNFARFWFRFIEPNLAFLRRGEFEKVQEIIKNDFENYASFGFEILSRELLGKYLNIAISDISSFWNREVEIDIFARFDGFCVVGECKYKGRKICKNVLNNLEAKCQKAGISPNYIALFSKSGFSEELISLKRPNLLLFDDQNFKILLD